MGTRSLIAIAGDTAIAYAYCHYDGYLAGVGRKLIETYNTEENALDIVTAGYLSSLENTVEESIEKSANEGSARLVSTHQDLLDEADGCGAEYVYLWEHGKWWYSERYTGETAERAFKKLDDTRLLKEIRDYYQRVLDYTLAQKKAA